VYGHIVRRRERGRDPTATRFEWDVFVLCGDPSSADTNRRGDIKGDAFGSPDGRTMFVNIQHPGETPSERSNPATPEGIRAWPDAGRAGGDPARRPW
jgi:secreted PhoX family phosphatase